MKQSEEQALWFDDERAAEDVVYWHCPKCGVNAHDYSEVAGRERYTCRRCGTVSDYPRARAGMGWRNGGE